MNPRIFISLALILILSNIFASSIISESFKIEEDYKIYLDLFYPPEEILIKEMGINLEEYKKLLKDTAPVNRNLSVPNANGTSPTFGDVRIPVLLIKFPDKNLTTYTENQINNAFNSENYVHNSIPGISVSKYYYKQSYGDLNLVFDIYDWRQLDINFSHYRQTDITRLQMIFDAVNTFDPYVDFAQYDSDGDNRLDGIVLIFPGQSSDSTIQAHTRILRNYTADSVDGKYLGNTAVIPELGKSGFASQFQIPVTTHEFAHVLGLPDLYGYGVGYNEGPVHNMTMMAFNEAPCLNKPINLDVWSRYFLGWINPVILNTDSPKEISLRSVNDHPDAVILKNSNMGPREFFIVENRHREDSANNLDRCMFSAVGFTNGGFAIYHVDENKIEYDYMDNFINWDRDGNYYAQTTWPGLSYEKNSISYSDFFINYNRRLSMNASDLYYRHSTDYWREVLDENMYPTANPPNFDTTSRPHSGIINEPFIRFNAISGKENFMKTAKILVGPETANPTINYPSGTYPENTQFVLNTTTPQSTIYYTIDGTDPTTSSLVYSAPITLPVGPRTLKAIAKRNNYYVSDIVSVNYTITGTVVAPQATPESGIVDPGAQVTLTTTTESATIRYTLDNSEPNSDSNIYTEPISITSTTTIKSKAFKNNYNPSDTVTFNYTLAAVSNPIASYQSGIVDFRTQVTLSTTTPQAIIRYTVNGTDPAESSPRYISPIYVVQPITLKARAFKEGQQPSEIVSYNYLVKLLTPRSNLESGIYPFTTKIKLTSEVPGTQIYYTTDGTDPNDGQLYTTHFRLLEDMHLRAIVKRTGYIDSEILNKTYTVSNQEQSVPKLLIDQRTPRGYESFDLIYITERHWADDVNFTITNLNSCTFNLRPIIYNDGHYTYYVFENNRCIRRIQTRLTLTVRDQNYQERVDAELIVLDPGLQAIAVGRE